MLSDLEPDETDRVETGAIIFEFLCEIHRAIRLEGLDEETIKRFDEDDDFDVEKDEAVFAFEEACLQLKTPIVC